MFPTTITTDRLRLHRLDRAVDARDLYDHTAPGTGFDEVTTHLTTDPHDTPYDARE